MPGESMMFISGRDLLSFRFIALNYDVTDSSSLPVACSFTNSPYKADYK